MRKQEDEEERKKRKKERKKERRMNTKWADHLDALPLICLFL
jgi:hypothetical protein